MSDGTVLKGNHSGSRVFTAGARVYYLRGGAGQGYERVFIMGRSRGGRWVRKWEQSNKMGNWRIVSTPPSGPLHKTLSDAVCGDFVLHALNAWARSVAI